MKKIVAKKAQNGAKADSLMSASNRKKDAAYSQERIGKSLKAKGLGDRPTNKLGPGPQYKAIPTGNQRLDIAKKLRTSATKDSLSSVKLRKKAQNGIKTDTLSGVTINPRSNTGGKKPWADKTPFEKQATRDSIHNAGAERAKAVRTSNARAAGFGTEGGGYDEKAYSKHERKMNRRSDTDRYQGSLNKVNVKTEKVIEDSGPAKAPCKGGGCKKESKSSGVEGVWMKSGGKIKPKKAQAGAALKNLPAGATPIPMKKGGTIKKKRK
jgi:hypothetical protein